MKYTFLLYLPCKARVMPRIIVLACWGLSNSCMGMVYGPSRRSRPTGLYESCPLLEWNGATHASLHIFLQFSVYIA